MLVHHRVTPSSMSLVTIYYAFILLGGVRQCGAKSFLSKEPTRWQVPGLEPLTVSSKSNALLSHYTIAPPQITCNFDRETLPKNKFRKHTALCRMDGRADGRTDTRTMENLPEGHKNWDTYFCTQQIGHTQRNVHTYLGKDKSGDPSHMSCTI